MTVSARRLGPLRVDSSQSAKRLSSAYFVEKLEFAVLPKLRRGRVRCGNAAQIAMLEARQDVRMRYKDFLVVLHIGAGFAPYEG